MRSYLSSFLDFMVKRGHWNVTVDAMILAKCVTSNRRGAEWWLRATPFLQDPLPVLGRVKPRHSKCTADESPDKSEAIGDCVHTDGVAEAVRVKFKRVLLGS